MHAIVLYFAEFRRMMRKNRNNSILNLVFKTKAICRNFDIQVTRVHVYISFTVQTQQSGSIFFEKLKPFRIKY